MGHTDQLIALGACQIQDKIFDNWFYSGGSTPAADVHVARVFDTSVEMHGWTFTNQSDATGGRWNQTFTLSYDIHVDLVNFPTVFISRAEDQINVSGSNASFITDTQTPDVGPVYTLITSHANDSIAHTLFPRAFNIHTVSVATVVPGPGGISTLEQHWYENAPEPSTWALLVGGAGMIGVGLLRRRR